MEKGGSESVGEKGKGGGGTSLALICMTISGEGGGRRERSTEYHKTLFRIKEKSHKIDIFNYL